MTGADDRRLRFLVAEDHGIVRDGLISLIGREHGWEVVAAAEDGRSAVVLALESTPDVVVMDVTMPRLNGIDATRQILSSSPATRIIALSVHTDGRIVTEMLRAGARGYLVKDAVFDELREAVRTVLEGRRYVSPGVLDGLLDDYLQIAASDPGSAFSVLSEREREVLQLIAEGRSTRQISLDLSVSVKTVESHRANIMKKLGASSVADLTRYAVREGIVRLEI